MAKGELFLCVPISVLMIFESFICLDATVRSADRCMSASQNETQGLQHHIMQAKFHCRATGTPRSNTATFSTCLMCLISFRKTHALVLPQYTTQTSRSEIGCRQPSYHSMTFASLSFDLLSQIAANPYLIRG